MIKKIYLKMYSNLCSNTHHNVIDSEIDGMVIECVL